MTSREVFMTATIDDQWRNSGFRFPGKQNRQVCWTSLQSDQNLRAPHIATQQRLSIDICLPAPNRSSKHADRRCCYRSMGQTNARTLDRFMTSTLRTVLNRLNLLYRHGCRAATESL